MAFLEFWRRKKERGELLQRTNQLRLLPSQLKWLLGDSQVRRSLQNGKMVSLLPPVGEEVFRRFTPASLDEIKQRHEAKKKEREIRKQNKEQAEAKGRPKPASHLEAGKPLPFIYGDPPPELLNTPLEELDPFYQSQKTFVVLGKGNVLHRFDADSCFLLSPLNHLRTASIKLLLHSLFRLFILVTILTNCVFMTISDCPAWGHSVEWVFMAIYGFEAIVKILSRGFCLGKFSFLRDPWNWLDVLVVSMGNVSQCVELGKVSALLDTTPRVLKILPLFSGVKATFKTMVTCVKRLAGVVALMLLVLSVLAVIGMQFFMGQLRHKCVIWASNMTYDSSYYDNHQGSSFDFIEYTNRAENYYYVPGQVDALLCGNSSDSGVCPEGFVCIRGGGNPNYGFTNFDSFGWSLLSILRLMSKDFWENLVQLTLRAAGKFHLTVFMLIIFPGLFCLVSLVLAVVAMAASEQEEARAAAANQTVAEFREIVAAVKRREEEEAGRRRHKDEDVDQNPTGSQNPTGGADQSSCPPCCSIVAERLQKWNCCTCWRWLKLRLATFIMNPFFDLAIVICLIINIIFMAMEHFPMTMEFEAQLSVAYLVFTAIFTAEMVLKLVALGAYGYFQVSWNIYDSIIVVINLLTLLLSDVEGLSVLRLSLLMRVFRLARWWPSLHMWLKIVWTSVWALRNLSLLLLVLVFGSSVVGMQVFQDDYKDCVCRISADCELPRWHMNDFFHTFLIVFRILCGQWTECLWDCMEVSGQTTCLLIFMVVLVFGYLLILNLFLTLLLSSLSSLEAPEQPKQNKVHIAINQIKTWFREHTRKHASPDQTAADSKTDDRKEYLALNLVPSDELASEFQTLSDPNTESLRVCMDPTETSELKTPEEEPGEDEDDEDHKGETPEACCSDRCYRCCPLLDVDTSQGRGKVWSNFRRACFFIAQHKYFEIFIIFIILLSSAALMLEDVHLQQRPLLKSAVETADQVFTYLFLLEMLLKWVAFGLKKYFSDPWCWLDFLVLDVFLVSLVAHMLGLSELGAIQFLRTLRALGPLRVLSRFRGPRLVMQVLVRSGPALFDWLLVLMTVWLFFCIVGVNLFAGKFDYCYNETSEEFFLPEQVNNKTECFELMSENFSDVRWKTLTFNYDSTMNGFVALLLLSASQDWFDVIYAAVDSRQVESQPVYEYNVYFYLYLIFFIISCFFSFNFFIRVFINNLQRDKIWKHVFMTEQQQKYSGTLKKLFPQKPQKSVPRPQNKCQAGLFQLLTSPYYEVFMVVLILLNAVLLMVETHDMALWVEITLHWINFFFIVVFLIEAIMKIIAFRCHYFKDSWNILDFVLVIFSIVGLFITDLLYYYFVTPAFIPLIRLARICRILNVFRCTRRIRKLLLAFVMSLPALFNISLVLFIIMVTSSLFGMFNFAFVKKAAALDDMFNFETFWSSMICVLFMCTSGGWGGLLIPIMSTPPDCDPHMENPGSTVRGDCGSPTVGIIFITTHICLSFLLVVQLYVTVVLETFNSDTEALSDEDLRKFYKTWRKFDADASQFIPYSKLSDFSDALLDPLRIPKPNTIKLIHMDLPLFPGDKVHCEDVLLALAAEVFDDPGSMDSLKARMRKFNSSKVSHEPISSTLRRKQEEAAATFIQRAYRKWVLLHADTRKAPLQSADGGAAE